MSPRVTPTPDKAPSPELAAATGRRERLRFASFKFDRTPSGQCSAQIVLELDNVRSALPESSCNFGLVSHHEDEIRS